VLNISWLPANMVHQLRLRHPWSRSQSSPWLILCLIVQAALLTHRVDLLADVERRVVHRAGRSKAVGAMLEMVRGDVHPPLYFLLAHYWIRIAPGDVLMQLRLLSVVFALLATIALDRLYGLSMPFARSVMVSRAVDLLGVLAALFPHGAIVQLAGLGIRLVAGRVAMEPGARVMETAADLVRGTGGAALHALRAGNRGWAGANVLLLQKARERPARLLAGNLIVPVGYLPGW
jgi:hypothetical protein